MLFRHTAATAWLENGGNMEDLRNILGHSKYDMAKRYAHVSNTSIKQSAEQYSVVARMDDI
jgi:integrase/recombinase XerD